MTEAKVDQKLIDDVNKAAAKLNAAPWWRPFKRQDAAMDYKNALLLAAFAEIDAKRARYGR